jgi:hypothetical protein
MRTVLLVALLALVTSAAAQVYRSVDKYGNVTFSDQPGPNSEKVYVPPVQTYTPRKLPGASGDATDAADEADPPSDYNVAIVEPLHEASLRDNDGNISVTVRVLPPLRDKHKLVLSLDGVPMNAPGSATSFVLPLVDRGTHKLVAEVVDVEGQSIKRSKPVTFHLKRVSTAGGG